MIQLQSPSVLRVSDDDWKPTCIRYVHVSAIRHEICATDLARGGLSFIWKRLHKMGIAYGVTGIPYNPDIAY